VQERNKRREIDRRVDRQADRMIEEEELRVRREQPLTCEPLAAHYPHPGSAAGLAIRAAGGGPPTASVFYIFPYLFVMIE